MDIKDIKGPLAYGWDIGLTVWIVLILAVIAVLVWFFTRKKKTALEAEETIPQVPPYEAARRALDSLKIRGFGPIGRVGEYYVLLSTIVRRYLEGRFDITVTDMTTEEFLDDLRKRSFLPPAHKELLREFLNSCDMVKFAKHEPTVEQMRESFDLADRIVEETKPVEEVKNATA